MILLTATLRDDTGEALAILQLSPKRFVTGRRGWYGATKFDVDGGRYQCQVQLVRIGAPGAGEDEREAVADGGR